MSGALKLENVYFRRFDDDPRKTLAELERRGKDAELLSQAYIRVNENLQRMQSLEVPGAWMKHAASRSGSTTWTAACT